jgi:hypothetical protein
MVGYAPGDGWVDGDGLKTVHAWLPTDEPVTGMRRHDEKACARKNRNTTRVDFVPSRGASGAIDRAAT